MTDNETLKGVIDRLEGDPAMIDISDEAERHNVPRTLLLQGTKEGDQWRLEVKDVKIIQAQLDTVATKTIQKCIDEKLARLGRSDHLKND
jgi:hypothetical protein